MKQEDLERTKEAIGKTAQLLADAVEHHESMVDQWSRVMGRLIELSKEWESLMLPLMENYGKHFAAYVSQNWFCLGDDPDRTYRMSPDMTHFQVHSSENVVHLNAPVDPKEELFDLQKEQGLYEPAEGFEFEEQSHPAISNRDEHPETIEMDECNDRVAPAVRPPLVFLGVGNTSSQKVVTRRFPDAFMPPEDQIKIVDMNKYNERNASITDTVTKYQYMLHCAGKRAHLGYEAYIKRWYQS